jgi:glycogen debranching enzyme
MPTKVTVNPGQIVINDGSTFLVTDSDGAIDENLAQGFFVRDTRLISYYEISLNRQPLELLASSNINHHSALYEYTNRQTPALNGNLPRGCLLVSVRRDIGRGMHEDIDIVNHHPEGIVFQLMLAIRSDFADIFQVKSNQLLPRGEITTTWENHVLTTEYRYKSFYRGLIVTPTNISSLPRYANGRLMFDIVLAPGEKWHLCLNFTALDDGEVLTPQHTCINEFVSEAGKVREDFLQEATQLKSPNADVVEFYNQALVDMGALRIKVQKNGENFWMPAAGIPWFMAVFGRDSIIASLQSLAIAREFACGTLIQLTALQATEIDDWRDAQPGKILHEYREDELSRLHQLPYTPYYGTVDATPLWIITLGEAYRWNASIEMLEECREPLEKALTWIDKYGDFDSDGFVEYQTRSPLGLRNQGWKDSGDAIVYPDGKLVEPPIALCEVQGEVYRAWQSAAAIYDVLGDRQLAQQLRQKAEDLYQHFNDYFWMEEEGFYCLGLDDSKQQIKSIASNPGQLLWTGIVPKERAGRLVERLFQTDLWCGWGVRTLSANHPAYNPISYQRGSVWPFDNSFIALGLKKYGYHRQVNQIAEGIFAAARYFEAGRMPELFGGIERRDDNFPIPYTDANIPQAWSAGSIFLLITTMLGLVADAPQQRLRVCPVLPKWLPSLELTNVQVGEATVALRFWRDQAQTRWEVTDLKGNLEVFESN